ncbi:MAG TPA: helix-turn-helix domain-containing protein, partial [Candidatus Angelobacter sp.]|nr:helix-turn-helix domain-containing protein [Candidatus Angelobacter sp.]
LQTHNWNRRRTAEVLKISYRALLYKIRDAGLSEGRSPTRNACSSVTAAPDSGAPKSNTEPQAESVSANPGIRF